MLRIFAAGLAVLCVANTQSLAGFSELAGRWQSDPLLLDEAPPCAPETISVSIDGDGSDARIEIQAGPDVDLDIRLVADDAHAVLVEPSGWMQRFGMSDATTRDSLIGHKPILWARESGEGAVVYRAQIAENGTLDLMRLALDPVDGAIAATLELASGNCRLDPITTSLLPQ